MRPFGIYLHWPFCLSKCPYCDFASFSEKNINYDVYENAFLSSIREYADITHEKEVFSIFFGGGTPSLMPPELVGRLINEIRAFWRVREDVEITLEANPGTLDATGMEKLSAAGINRLSIGVQALNDSDLRLLGRIHDAKTALQAVSDACLIFQNVSMDLIYARPNQTLKAWEKELEQALLLNLPHYSLYQLTIEEGTPFFTQGLELPEEDLAADMFELTDKMTYAAGIPRYEVSNHARKGYECRHNLLYWHGGEWIGIGPAAHGRFSHEKNIYATENSRIPQKWLKGEEATKEVLSLSQQAEELILMGLRTEKGILQDRFKEIIGQEPEAFMHSDILEDFQMDGLIVRDSQGIRTTPKGLLLLNGLSSSLLA